MTGDTLPLCFDLSGFPIQFRGLPAEVAERLAQRWEDYRAPASADAVVELAVRVEGEPMVETPLDLRRMTTERRGAQTRLSLIDGTLELHDGAAASVRLAPGPPERQYWVLINLVCAVLGRRVVERGAVLLHAAAVIIDGRGFVMVAPEGGGKTTWADLARKAGALYLSDDVVFVDHSRGQLDVLSTPIRGNHPKPLPPGRWPVAALLLPRHGVRVALEPAAQLRVLGRLEANVLFTAETRPYPALEALLEKIAEGTNAFELTFCKDASFMDALRALHRLSG